MKPPLRLVPLLLLYGCGTVAPEPKPAVQTGKNEAATIELQRSIRENFGMKGYETSWFPSIKEVWAEDGRAIARTDLIARDSKAGSICGVLSSFVNSNNQPYGLTGIRVLAADGRVLFEFEGVRPGGCSP